MKKLLEKINRKPENKLKEVFVTETGYASELWGYVIVKI